MDILHASAPEATVHASFEQVYEQHFASIYRAVYVLTRDPERAREATQEAFARAFARWSRLRTQDWAVAWIARTAMNVAKRTYRRSSAPDTVREILALPDPALGMVVRDALTLLSERQRQAVVLVYLLQFSVSEAAAAMDCAEGTIKSHLSRAREILRRILDLEERNDG